MMYVLNSPSFQYFEILSVFTYMYGQNSIKIPTNIYTWRHCPLTKLLSCTCTCSIHMYIMPTFIPNVLSTCTLKRFYWHTPYNIIFIVPKVNIKVDYNFYAMIIIIASTVKSYRLS